MTWVGLSTQKDVGCICHSITVGHGGSGTGQCSCQLGVSCVGVRTPLSPSSPRCVPLQLRLQPQRLA